MATERKYRDRIKSLRRVPAGKLRANPQNWRRHPDKQKSALRGMLEEVGFADALIARETGDGSLELIDGHLRAEIADGEKLPVLVLDVDEAEARKLLATVDPMAALAEGDQEQLNSLISEIDTTSDAVRAMLDNLSSEGGSSAEPEEDEPPDPPADPVTRQGDVWVMGELGHRVMCGDCRSADEVGRLLSGESINVAVTSPPYASQREYDESSGFKPIPTDEYVEWFDAVQQRVAEHLAGDGSWLINIKEHCEDGQRVLYVRDLVLRHVREWGWRFIDEFAWVHGGTPKAPNARFKNGWEPIFQFARGKHKFRPDAVAHPSDDVPDWSGLHPNAEDVQRYGTTEGMARKGVDARTKKGDGVGGKQGYGDGVGDREAGAVGSGMAYPSNVVKAGKNKDALGHSAAYPIGLPSFFVRALTDEADNAYDPFLGSGTTLIAAHQLGRRCFGMEISSQYCDVICRRYLNLTGESPVREADGAKFTDLIEQ